jgi:hypothetical protein
MTFLLQLVVPALIMCFTCYCQDPTKGHADICEGTDHSNTQVTLTDQNGSTLQHQVSDSSTSLLTWNNVSSQPASPLTWGEVHAAQDCELVVLSC